MSGRSGPMLYFDHNATTPLHPVARDAWLRASDEFIGNPSSPHRLGARAEAALQSARETVAGILGCDPADLLWTAGATESANTVLHHLARQPSTGAAAGAEVWVSAVEHPCVLAPAERHFPGRCRRIPVDADGVVRLDWLADALRRSRPALLAVMAVNNETGVLQPWRDVLALAREHGVPFFCDAAQWVGKLPGAGLGACDFVGACAHKFGGPKGAGFLKCPSRGPLHPLLAGGPQEDSRRAGTENVAAIVAFAAVLARRETELAAGGETERLAWRRSFEAELAARLPGVRLVAREAPRLWNTVCALMPEADCRQRWVVKLDRAGAAVSTGSACASGKEEPSHVLSAMGLAPAEAGRALRFSSGWETSAAEWGQLLARLEAAAARGAAA